MEKLIQECAQKIMNVLGASGEINLLRLSERIAERSMVVYQAVGWLAREGRVVYAQREKQVYVRLRPEGTNGGAPSTRT